MPEKKILIVDSDATSRNFLTRSLLEQKFDVIEAGSAKEGLIFAWRDRPDLMVVDPAVADVTGEDLAVKLKQDPRTGNMPLIALSSDPSPARMKSCLEAGFNEYIVKSGQALSSLSDTINRLLGISSSVAKQGGMLIVFLSAKGGSGTSSLCANIAMNMVQNQPEARVAVIDLVLPISSIGPLVGYEGAQDIVTIAEMPASATSPAFFRDQLSEVKPWRFKLLSGSPDPDSSNRLNVTRIWDMVVATKLAYDYVLVDLGRSLSKFVLPLIQHADLIALIISTDLSSVSLTKTLLEYLKSKGVKETGIYTILNRAVGLEGLTKTEAEKVLEIPIMVTVPYLGGNFSLSNNQHQPFSLKFPKDTASVIFKDAAREIASLSEKLRME
jgi:MinD-like ATPase involved in chromosome partitioning or flagellar assembly/CheY-like chemotaxis protein